MDAEEHLKIAESGKVLEKNRAHVGAIRKIQCQSIAFCTSQPVRGLKKNSIACLPTQKVHAHLWQDHCTLLKMQHQNRAYHWLSRLQSYLPVFAACSVSSVLWWIRVFFIPDACYSSSLTVFCSTMFGMCCRGGGGGLITAFLIVESSVEQQCWCGIWKWAVALYFSRQQRMTSKSSADNILHQKTSGNRIYPVVCSRRGIHRPSTELFYLRTVSFLF